MGIKINLAGQKFGKWSVVKKSPSPTGYEHQQFWLCRCECGTEAIRKGSQLRYAEKKGVNQSCQSCGAIAGGTTHGLSKTPEYKAWFGMIDRCNNPSNKAYKNYGERGIQVCSRWKLFKNFLSDMGARPSIKHSLDRINNAKGYSKNNCRWATSKTQNRNRRGNHLIAFNGKTQSISAWAEETGIDRSVLYMRINSQGWSIDDALTITAGSACNWRGTPHKDAKQYSYKGKTQGLSEWATELNISRSTLSNRLSRGWDIERVFGSK